ncbi:MAG: hypothetical protein JKY66_04040, partial [Spongiibacteraceae bacterium]|nr:hypothetical protein [Spongiibacteraceae bacterium]
SAGASTAVNSITNSIQSYILGSTIVSDGDVEFEAQSNAAISAITIAGAGGGSGGAVGGVSVSGAASSSVNIIVNSVNAYFDSSSVSSAHSGTVALTALDRSLIMANAGGAAAGGAGGAVGGVVASVGAAAAVNTINNNVSSYITNSVVASAGVAAAPEIVALDLAAAGSKILVDDEEIDFGQGNEHGLATGNAVVYSNTGGNSIAGLENGKTYYAIVDASDFTATDHVDSAANKIELGLDHGFTTGEAVIYENSSSGGGQDIEGLVNAAVYYVIEIVDAKALNLAAVNDASYSINLAAGHEYVTGDALVYKNGGGNNIGELQDSQVYYVIANRNEFNPLSAVHSLDDSVDLGLGPEYATGDAVTYSNGGGVSIDGLVDEQVYFLVVDGENPGRVKFALSYADAVADTAIVIDIDSSTASGNKHSVTFNNIIQLAKSRANAFAGEIIAINSSVASGAGHTLESNSEIKLAASYADALTATAINLDTNGNSGNAHSIISASRMSLAETKADALIGNRIDIDVPVSNNNHSFTKTELVDLTALSDATIWALTIGGAGAGSGGAIGGVSVSGAGAGSVNIIVNTTESYIDSGSDVSTANGVAVGITSVDDSLIMANSGGASFSGSGGAVGGVSISSGSATAINTVTNTIRSYISNSGIDADGALDLNALSSSLIFTITTAGAGAGSGGAVGGVSVAAAGAGSVNIIANTIESYIDGGSTISTGNAKDLSVRARDSASIIANAGGASVAGSGGVGGGVSVSSGTAAAVSDIANTTRAYIDNSVVNSDGGVVIEATSDAAIWTLSLGGSFSGSGGIVGASIANSGSVATNIIINSVEAYIKGNSDISTNNGQAVLISAQDKADIQATAATQSIAFVIGSSGAAVSIGNVVSVNEITNTVLAYIDNSKINSAGGIGISAASTSTMDSSAVATSVAAGIAPFSLNIAGSGSTAANKIENTLFAYIKDSADVTASGDIIIVANDSSIISSDVGSGSVTFGPLGASVGISVSDNIVDNRVKSSIENSTVTSSAGAIKLSSLSAGDIDALAVATSIAAAPGGGSEAGSFANSTITTETEAFVDNNTTLTANTDIEIISTADNDADVETAGTAIAGLAASGQSIANASVGGSTVAYMDGTVNGAVNLLVKANSISSVEADAFALGGGIVTGSGADAVVVLNPTITAYTNGDISISGDLKVIALSDAEAEADAVGISIGGLAVGVSLANAVITPDIDAYIQGGTVIATGGISVSALHNFNEAGTLLAKGADAAATAATGALIGGAGADA